MNRLIIFLLFIGFSSILHAQKSKVISVFQLIETAKYEDAKKAIEEAIIDEKTMEWPRTWYARGFLCQTANDKKKSDLYPDQLYVAFESYEKALELDARGRVEVQLAPLYVLLANDFQKLGEKHFNSKKYKDALKAFEHALQINRSPILTVKIDTNLVYNTALAAYESKDWGKAIGYLSMLHKNNYSTNVTHLLFTGYLENGDTLSAERVILEGIEHYDDKEVLVLLLVDHLFLRDVDRAVSILDVASASGPDKYIYPYTKGLIYQKTNQYQKAIDAYKEAIDLAQDELKIYKNMGTCYYNIGVEIEENSRAIINNKSFLEEKAKSIVAFESAVNCLEKVYEKDPRDQQVIVKLYELYKVLHITDKLNIMKEQIL